MSTTWTRQPLFTKEQIKSTMQTTLWQRVRLLFRRNHYLFDDGLVVQYKKMDGKIFFTKVITKL